LLASLASMFMNTCVADCRHGKQGHSGFYLHLFELTSLNYVLHFVKPSIKNQTSSNVCGRVCDNFACFLPHKELRHGS
jgi:hypothetical protein